MQNKWKGGEEVLLIWAYNLHLLINFLFPNHSLKIQSDIAILFLAGLIF